MPRKNLSPNPAAGVNNTGWTGSITPTQVTGLSGAPRSTGVRYASNSFMRSPTGAASPGLSYTASWYLTNNTGFTISGKTLYAFFSRSAGGDDSSNTVAAPTITAGSTVRCSIVVASSPALTTGLSLGMDSSGAGIDITACLIEQASSLDTYADGNTGGWTWDGTAENSSSSETGGATPINIGDAGSAAEALSIAVTLGLGDAGSASDTANNGVATPKSLGETGSALDGLLAVNYVPPIIPVGGPGSWWKLASITQLNRDYWRDEQDPPMACPNDGEPLITDTHGRLRCRYDGYIWRR